jgi:hypothetical protein
MDDFIRNENLKLFRRALAESTDREQREVLRGLLRLLVAEGSPPPAFNAEEFDPGGPIDRSLQSCASPRAMQ